MYQITDGNEKQRIADLEKRNAELEAWLGKEQEVKRDD